MGRQVPSQARNEASDRFVTQMYRCHLYLYLACSYFVHYGLMNEDMLAITMTMNQSRDYH